MLVILKIFIGTFEITGATVVTRPLVLARARGTLTLGLGGTGSEAVDSALFGTISGLCTRRSRPAIRTLAHGCFHCRCESTDAVYATIQASRFAYGALALMTCVTRVTCTACARRRPCLCR